MSMKATMKVDSVSGDENATAREVRLSTVITSDPKDNSISNATPHGQVSIRIEGENVNEFEKGDLVTITFSKKKKKADEE